MNGTLHFLKMAVWQILYYNPRNPAGKQHAVHFYAKLIWGRLLPRYRSLAAMKNIYEVLREKELNLARLRTEVEALRFVVPLLADRDGEPNDDPGVRRPDHAWTPALERNKWPLKMGDPAPTYSDS
jgi:hypothetical protein